MLSIFNGVRDITMLSVTVRLCLAVLCGGMIGLELVKDQKSKEPAPELTAALIQECAKNGLMIENAGTYGNVIRFLAPLVITDEQLEAGLEIMEKALVKCM